MKARAKLSRAKRSAGEAAFTEVRFTVGDKASTARIYRAPQPADRLLVLAHGAGANQSHAFMIGFATALAARGIDVVTFDFWYSAAGRGAPDRNDALESCWRAALALARAQFGGRVPFIGGKSMGGRIASHLAAAGDDARGLVLLGYPLHPPQQLAKLRVEHLPRVKMPTLIVQGQRDPFGAPDELRPHFARPTTTIAALPGAHSYDEKAWPDAHALVADFILR
ncbi:MAG TPA: alpha/beta fold hydrolase [Polyangia bacterium]|nr:alpha/beta fold hydrolase [Polyangia bacterium]